MSKYKVENFCKGMYSYDTVSIEIDGVEYNIPCQKGIFTQEIIGKEIEIKNIYMPIEKKIETKPTK